MSTAIQPAPGVRIHQPRAERREALRNALLACGALSSLLYVFATDGIGASQWAGYDRTRQMVSDLFAIGSPARPTLLVLVVGGYTVLLVAFAIGVWASARGSRRLRFTAGALAGYAVSIVVAACFPLTLGSAASVPMHIVATNLNLTLMLACIACGAAAFPGRFRTYSVATIAVTTVTGLVAFASAPAGPSLWLGVGERISIGTSLLWFAVLAVAVGRRSQPGHDLVATGPRRRSIPGRIYDWVDDRCSKPTGP